jgi:ribosomal subunit interface protein
MEIHTTARRVRMTPAAQRHLEERLSKVARYVKELQGDGTTAHVKLSGEKHGVRAEILLRVRHEDLVAREDADDALSALDGAVGRLEHQLRRLKEKKSRKVAARRVAKAPVPRAAAQLALGVTPGRRAKAAKATAEGRPVAAASARAAVASRPRIVRLRAPAVPLTLDEAVERFEESGETLLYFTDRDSGRPSVLFRRRDGQLAMLAPALDGS